MCILISFLRNIIESNVVLKNKAIHKNSIEKITAFLITVIVSLPNHAIACSNSEYESCWTINLLVGEAKDCKCYPKIGGTVGQVAEAGKSAINEEIHFGTDVLKVVIKGTNDTVAVVSKAGNDIVVNYAKAWKDTTEQTKRSFNDGVDAGAAALRYQERVTKDYLTSLGNSERRLREGKVVDAAWGLATEPVQSQEKNFFKATQESHVINDAAASAAAFYGGPGGAAAYASWSTYKSTGDATLAMRVGIIAGLSSELGSSSGATLSTNATTSEIVRKATIAGAAGGIAIAAQGGDEAAIKDGFLKSAGSVLIQVSKNKLNSSVPNASNYIEIAECVSAKDVSCLGRTAYVRDVNGKLVKEISKDGNYKIENIDPKTQIGHWVGVNLNDPSNQNLKQFANISKLPNSNIIAMYDGRVVLTTTLGTNENIEYGKPQVVLTILNGPSPFKFQRKFQIAHTENGYYSCKIQKITMTVKTKVQGNSCKTLYTRSDGNTQIIWNTPSHPNACSSKAAAFVKSLEQKGVDCSPT